MKIVQYSALKVILSGRSISPRIIGSVALCKIWPRIDAFFHLQILPQSDYGIWIYTNFFEVRFQLIMLWSQSRNTKALQKLEVNIYHESVLRHSNNSSTSVLPNIRLMSNKSLQCPFWEVFVPIRKAISGNSEVTLK